MVLYGRWHVTIVKCIQYEHETMMKFITDLYINMWLIPSFFHTQIVHLTIAAALIQLASYFYSQHLHTLHTRPLPILSFNWGYCKIIFGAVASCYCFLMKCTPLANKSEHMSRSSLTTHASLLEKTKTEIKLIKKCVTTAY